MTQTEQQVTNIHQPSAWPVPNACAQSYHPGSGSHRQLFHPYQGSSAWHGRRTYAPTNSGFFLLLLLFSEAGVHKVVQCCAAHQHTKHRHKTTTLYFVNCSLHLASGWVHSTPNIAGVMSHVRQPLLNYTISSISTAHKDTLKKAGGLTKLTNFSAIAKRPH